MTHKPLLSIHAKAAVFFLLVLSTFTCLAAKGEQLYLDNCAICHSREGQGGVGIPLGLEAFLEQTPNEYIRRTIRVGRPGRIMPSFYRLSNDDIDAIVSHIRSWRDSRVPEWNATPIKADASKGKALFAAHCVSCHGKDARGGKGQALTQAAMRAALAAHVASSNSPVWQSATKFAWPLSSSRTDA